MQYFKNPDNGQIYAYDDDADPFDPRWYVPGLVRMTAEEVQAMFDAIAAEQAAAAADAILAAAINEFNSRTRVGNAQALAINGRIATLTWQIYDQDPEDPDYIEPTAEDVAELAALKPLLTKWNSYNVKLGKVKTQPTWPSAPVWPVAPAIYLEGANSTTPSVS